jgi:MGT family glycosyltransferase
MHFVAPDYQHGAATAHPVRPVPFSPTPRDAFRLDAATRRPVVHVTFGTILGARRALDVTIEALRDRDGTVVLTTPHPIEAFGSLPASFHLARWAAHERLLPQCDVVVHHGGWGTTFACLAAGVPAVILPQYADGPVNAMKVAAAGAGIALRAGAQTPDRVRGAIERVLRDPLYRRNAERVRDEINAMPPPARAAELLEELARTRAPIAREAR